MNLSHDPTALAELKSGGGILDRQHFLQPKSHVINDHRRVDDPSLEGRCMTGEMLVRLGVGCVVV